MLLFLFCIMAAVTDHGGTTNGFENWCVHPVPEQLPTMVSAMHYNPELSGRRLRSGQQPPHPGPQRRPPTKGNRLLGNMYLKELQRQHADAMMKWLEAKKSHFGSKPPPPPPAFPTRPLNANALEKNVVGGTVTPGGFVTDEHPEGTMPSFKKDWTEKEHELKTFHRFVHSEVVNHDGQPRRRWYATFTTATSVRKSNTFPTVFELIRTLNEKAIDKIDVRVPTFLIHTNDWETQMTWYDRMNVAVHAPDHFIVYQLAPPPSSVQPWNPPEWKHW